MAPTNSDNDSGCGCLVLLGICGLIALIINTCNGNDEKNRTAPQKQAKTETYYNPQTARETIENAEEELSDEDKKYLNNSLSTGAAPYAEYYGKNYKCPYDQCSGIKVTAPHESDIVVIIKRNNANGKVISHAYIKAGDTCFFPIPDGTYQTFFYYGEGWNPNKEMTGGIRGGFVKNEIFSKDNPQEIYSGILTYVLQLQRDGNFQTRGSNRNEVF